MREVQAAFPYSASAPGRRDSGGGRRGRAEPPAVRVRRDDREGGRGRPGARRRNVRTVNGRGV
jgi:hypothetical protein